MTKALDNLLTTLAEKLGMGDDGAGLLAALKTTAFKPAKINNAMVAPTDGQIMALLVVATQYGLNPWLKELYAYPDKHGGIVPVVGVDGWSRIINTHSQYDGVDFEQDENGCTCTIYRKDRSHPTRITEYMVECRGSIGPWLTHPYRMWHL
jgi:phage recombination protein Bet